MTVPKSRFAQIPFFSAVLGGMLLLLLAGYGAVAYAASGPGLICKTSQVSAVGNHHLQKASKRQAYKRWQEKAASLYSPSYARWGRAKARSTSCTHGALNGKLNWRCRASGLPCRLNVSSTPHRPNVMTPKSRLKLRKTQ